jgi:organic hydroperoxide reductase OsmC/OhrA
MANDRVDRMHEYSAQVQWTGNVGEGTASYTSYERGYVISMPGKPDLYGSADPAFHGDASRHNPEDLFVAAIAACHMLSYLALCARSGVTVLSYDDVARATLVLNPGGGGRFREVVLSPIVTIAEGVAESKARAFHETAHQRCFIASSCSVPIRVEATVHRLAATSGAP